MPLGRALAPFGLTRLSAAPRRLLAGLPPRRLAEASAHFNAAKSVRAAAAEIEAFPASAAQARAAGGLRDLPLLVLSSGTGSAAFRALHAELAALSTNGVHLTVPGATHLSLLTNRAHAHVAAAAICDLVERARVRDANAARRQPTHP
jgi:hypothetical protein